MKNKKIFVLSVLSVVATMVITTMAVADTITAYKRDAFFQFQGNPADHTYACVNNRCYAINNSSRSGGRYVTGNYVSRQNGIFAICASGCYMSYARNGICHQHTNRLLFYAGRTLDSRVQGYSLSRLLFGTYGDVGPISGRFSSCRRICSG